MSENQKSSRESRMEKYFFRASAEDFANIPGSPFAYWVSDSLRNSFRYGTSFEDIGTPRQGLGTGNNAKFTRHWSEVSLNKIFFDAKDKKDALISGATWFPYTKGGGFRKWFGNELDVVNWQFDGMAIKEALKGMNPNIPRSEEHYFKQGISWGLITSAAFSARYCKEGSIFDVGGSKAMPSSDNTCPALGLLNSKVTAIFLKALNPTLNFQVGDIKRIPVLILGKNEGINCVVDKTLRIARNDWNAYENSWGFTSFPLLHPDYRMPTLKATYQTLRDHWSEMTLEMQGLEEENNRIFIEAYGLQDELTPEVPLKEITLTCNPYYRYGGDKTKEELEALLLADTMRELVSYAVGCMFGRYSLDKPGLILANQGETLADYLAQVPQPSFPADDDNVIPMLDGDWFPDDITLRFRQFLRVAFGDAHYEDNLAFIEQTLNVKGKRNYSLRDYFLGEFYADHVKRYKKRPIYWLFSSPKGSFNALIYMHRYRPDTVSVVLKYLRDYREKLSTEKNRQAAVSINPSSSQGEKTKALKEVDRLTKVLTELDDYERDVLYPLATEQKSIDLDDGVKVNYLKFGAALKKIPGLDAKDE